MHRLSAVYSIITAPHVSDVPTDYRQVVGGTPRKDPVPIVQDAGWGPRAGLDVCGKSRPPPGFDPRTVQPVASRYTD
jgi:hypothetical protein